jgi:C-terminal processing protease CtpA/Prc
MNTYSSVCFRLALFIFVVALTAKPSYAGTIDNDRQLMVNVLKVVCRDVEDRYYDPQLKGLDWKTLKAQAEERIKKANSPREMDIAIYWLLDQLHDSHTVYVPPMHTGLFSYGFDAHGYGDVARISKIRKKGAAEQAGLQVGDQLVSLQGYPVGRNNVEFLMYGLQFLRPSPELTVVYSRDGAPPQQTVIRAKVEERKQLQNFADSLDDFFRMVRQWENYEAEYGKSRLELSADGVAMMRILDFTHDGIGTLAKKSQSATAFVIDLRGNRGGAVSILRDFIGYFEDQKVVVSDMVGRKNKEQIAADPRRKSPTPPMVILVDAESSSAAEAFAYHFQRTKKAVIVGDRSSGRLTAARFYPEKIGVDTIVMFGVGVAEYRVVFPDGKELEGVGVQPDELCVPSEGDIRENRDICLAKAFERLKNFKSAGD